MRCVVGGRRPQQGDRHRRADGVAAMPVWFAIVWGVLQLVGVVIDLAFFAWEVTGVFVSSVRGGSDQGAGHSPMGEIRRIGRRRRET